MEGYHAESVAPVTMQEAIRWVDRQAVDMKDTADYWLKRPAFFSMREVRTGEMDPPDTK